MPRRQTYRIDLQPIMFNGDHYFLPEFAMHRPAVKRMLEGRIHEPLTHAFVARLLAATPGSIVHAGTFFGDMLPGFSRATSGTVYAFEPVLENYVLARLCIQANNLTNIILFNAALAGGITNAQISTRQPDGRHAGGASHLADDGVICPTMNIDALAADDLVLIQLDIEGAELEALGGATASIERCRPVIAIEDNNKNCASFLDGLDYVRQGVLPQLEIWVPREKGPLDAFAG